jgi:hypothetical protein
MHQPQQHDGRLPQTPDPRQLLRRPGQDLRQPTEGIQQLPGQRLHVHPGNGIAQQQFQQCQIGAGPRITRQEPLPEPLPVTGRLLFHHRYASIASIACPPHD